MNINQAKTNTSIKKHNQSIIKHSQSNSITIIKDNLNSSRKQASKVINQRQVTCWYHLILLVGVDDEVAFVCCLHKSHIHFYGGEIWSLFVVFINHISTYLGEKRGGGLFLSFSPSLWGSTHQLTERKERRVSKICEVLIWIQMVWHGMFLCANGHRYAWDVHTENS